MKNTYLTIGVFDGVHLGHQEVVNRLVKETRLKGGRGILLTFNPHPLKVVAPQKAPLLLTSLKERKRLLSELGIDETIILPFNTKLASLGGEDFVREVLLPLGTKRVFVGEDYLFGRERRGDTALLRKMGTRHGFGVEDVPPVKIRGETVSSSRIRGSLMEGRVQEAAELLGRLPSRRGLVIPGEGQGQTIGYPTANLKWDRELLLPANGVYSVYVMLQGKRLPGMANIGLRPTFKKKDLNLEVHIFDFSETIYNQEVEVAFVERIRDEESFCNPTSLKNRLREDEEICREILVYKEREI